MRDEIVVALLSEGVNLDLDAAEAAALAVGVDCERSEQSSSPFFDGGRKVERRFCSRDRPLSAVGRLDRSEL